MCTHCSVEYSSSESLMIYFYINFWLGNDCNVISTVVHIMKWPKLYFLLSAMWRQFRTASKINKSISNWQCTAWWHFPVKYVFIVYFDGINFSEYTNTRRASTKQFMLEGYSALKTTVIFSCEIFMTCACKFISVKIIFLKIRIRN